MKLIDGFWLPRSVREQVLVEDTEYATLSFVRGRPAEPTEEGAVTARWPVLSRSQWTQLLATLRANRQRAPQGQELWDGFKRALGPMAQRFADRSDPLRIDALGALPGYTGYSEAMIRLTLGALDLWDWDQLSTAFALDPRHEVAENWQPMDGLPGRLRFYPAARWQRILGRVPGRGNRALFAPPSLPDLVVGYGAGNVPGTALLIAMLAQATALAGGAPPVVVVKNSRREPIFAPLVLDALEAADPDLVGTIAVLIWDYENADVQRHLLAQADLVIAAAGDDTIAQIGASLDGTARSNSVRFHPHGHKVSFSAIGREVLARGLCEPISKRPLLEVVTLLAALDSVFWDQHGCLSSRMHFVETVDDGQARSGPSKAQQAQAEETHTALEYAEKLAGQMRLLAAFLPRGSWPRQRLHDRFDRYKLLETTGEVRVLSEYDEEFVVALDERPLGAAALQSMVNDCEGRVIIVRPVADLREVPDNYLRLLPAANLQSLSVAVGRAGEGLTERFLRFAEACGAQGVTAFRTLGRGAFPQLAYSWDGLIPLDLVRQRPAGRFATIEFERPYDEVLATYRLYLEQGTDLEPGPGRFGEAQPT